jgi:hypothetical protein
MILTDNESIQNENKQNGNDNTKIGNKNKQNVKDN